MHTADLLHDSFIIHTRGADKPIGLDISCPAKKGLYPTIIYAHGFNGFKDWGGMNLVADRFAEAGFVFIKFNFSHNGTTPEMPLDFTDLDAYARNTYTKELHDLRVVTDWVSDAANPFAAWIDTEQIALIGHSRGGGIVLIGASEDERVKAVVTWASVNVCKTPWGLWPAQRMEAWKETGVQHIANSRTHQQMPLNYSLYEDYHQNMPRLDLERAVRDLTVPLLICHGTEDTSVPPAAAEDLHNWQPASEIFLLPTDHVFGRRHPWTAPNLPEATIAVVDRSIAFLQARLPG